MHSVQFSRPPLDRMLKIHAELRENNRPNCTSLSRALEVSRKTIVRDIAFMRDRLGLPIDYDPAAQSYHYSRPVENFPTILVSEGDLLALLVAQRALQQYQGTPYHRQLASAFEKITGGLRDRITFSSAAELDAVSFKNFGLGKTDISVFTQLSQAVLRRRTVMFAYRKTGDPSSALRQVRPYHLSNRENLWYLVGWDEERKEVRTFAVPRISEVKLTARSFPRPTDFSPESAFAGAFAALGGNQQYPVRIKFSRECADLVRERVWHESQRIEDLPGGTLVLSLDLGALKEIERWILSWGPGAEVLAPPELRRAVAASAEKTSAIYSAEQSSPPC